MERNLKRDISIAIAGVTLLPAAFACSSRSVPEISPTTEPTSTNARMVSGEFQNQGITDDNFVDHLSPSSEISFEEVWIDETDSEHFLKRHGGKQLSLNAINKREGLKRSIDTKDDLYAYLGRISSQDQAIAFLRATEDGVLATYMGEATTASVGKDGVSLNYIQCQDGVVYKKSLMLSNRNLMRYQIGDAEAISSGTCQ